MLRYSLILLLVNIYGRSLGGPVPQQNSNGKILIANLLNDLGKQCKNKFVLGQIESKNSSCDVELNYHVVDLQCLMFFDANRLLCNSSANLETDFTAKISEKQNVSAFCNEVSHLSVPSAPYQQMITTVFQGEDTCKKVCADEDIRTGDTNFYCKYYKWTLSKLTAVTSTANSAGALSDAAQKNDIIPTSHSTDGQEKITPDTAASNKPQEDKAEETNPPKVIKQESSSTVRLNAQNAENPNLSSSVNSSFRNVTQKPLLESDNTAQGSNKKPTDNTEQLNSVADSSDGRNEAGIENNGGNQDPDLTKPQIENPGRNLALENVNDDGDETVIDMDDDGRVSDDEDQNGSDVEVRLNEVPNPDTRLETQGSQNAGTSQREFFQTTDGFTEDDDHFFPFFLTAVIVVVVLYVLYHNKNKVGKMFFGLIVEGRQTGRRRTSRGHAYRRLDTLEQAMSANTTAPPSKIIY